MGFYRTQYTSEMLDALLPAIRDGSLPPRDRLGLQNDLFALVISVISSCIAAWTSRNSPLTEPVTADCVCGTLLVESLIRVMY